LHPLMSSTSLWKAKIADLESQLAEKELAFDLKDEAIVELQAKIQELEKANESLVSNPVVQSNDHDKENDGELNTLKKDFNNLKDLNTKLLQQCQSLKKENATLKSAH
jgi:chromosome segregation ATPase